MVEYAGSVTAPDTLNVPILEAVFLGTIAKSFGILSKLICASVWKRTEKTRVEKVIFQLLYFLKNEPLQNKYRNCLHFDNFIIEDCWLQPPKSVIYKFYWYPNFFF